MIEDGCLDGVDVIFGVHLQAQTPLGEINYREGALQAAADFFEIKIQGQGGHGAYPHQTKDSIVIGSNQCEQHHRGDRSFKRDCPDTQ